jgi:hypothetical protein
MEVSGQLNAPAALPTGKDSRTHWIGSWVGTGDGLDFGRRENSHVPSSIRTLGPSSSGPGGDTEFMFCVHIVRIMRVLSLVLSFYLVSEYIRTWKNKTKENCPQSFLTAGQAEVILIEVPFCPSVHRTEALFNSSYHRSCPLTPHLPKPFLLLPFPELAMITFQPF